MPFRGTMAHGRRKVSLFGTRGMKCISGRLVTPTGGPKFRAISEKYL
jgi:hypothetical protein